MKLKPRHDDIDKETGTSRKRDSVEGLKKMIADMKRKKTQKGTGKRGEAHKKTV